jgi:hypothetical protein
MAYAMGEVHRLSTTNNMLVVFPMCPPLDQKITYNEWTAPRHYKDFSYGGRIQEYTRGEKGKMVFDVRIEDADDVMVWAIYGGLRLGSLYPTSAERLFQVKP